MLIFVKRYKNGLLCIVEKQKRKKQELQTKTSKEKNIIYI